MCVWWELLDLLSQQFWNIQFKFVTMQYAITIVTMLCLSILYLQSRIFQGPDMHVNFWFFSPSFQSRPVILNLEVYKMYRNLYLDCEYCSWRDLKDLSCILKNYLWQYWQREDFLFRLSNSQTTSSSHKIRFSRVHSSTWASYAVSCFDLTFHFPRLGP